MSFASLMASLAPATWLRLNDNAASDVVTDSSASPSHGSLFSAVTPPTHSAVNTSTRSYTPGLVAGDADKCFDMGGNSIIKSPGKTLSNAIGWTAFAIIRPTSAPPPSAAWVACVFQLSSFAAGVPELDIIDVGSGKFRFRVMRSGSSEISMSATPTWSYGDTLAVALKKRAGGLVDLFVNGSLVASSTATPSFVYSGGVQWWGSAYFPTSSSFYQFPGYMDELALFTTPLSDAQCLSLTSAPF